LGGFMDDPFDKPVAAAAMDIFVSGYFVAG